MWFYEAQLSKVLPLQFLCDTRRNLLNLQVKITAGWHLRIWIWAPRQGLSFPFPFCSTERLCKAKWPVNSAWTALHGCGWLQLANNFVYDTLTTWGICSYTRHLFWMRLRNQCSTACFSVCEFNHLFSRLPVYLLDLNWQKDVKSWWFLL